MSLFIGITFLPLIFSESLRTLLNVRLSKRVLLFPWWLPTQVWQV
jgi:hypothetical protein